MRRLALPTRRRIRKAQAFTLLELLVAAVVTVPVAMLTLGIFANAGALQVQRTNSHELVAGVRAIQEQIEADIIRAGRHPSDSNGTRYDIYTGTATGTTTGTYFTVLAARVAYQQEGTTAPQPPEWRIYCFKNDGNQTYIERLRANYVENSAYHLRLKSPLSYTDSCDGNLMVAMDRSTGQVPQPPGYAPATRLGTVQRDRLNSTDKLAIQSFQVWPIYFSPSLSQLKAIRYEISAKYPDGNGGVGINPVTVRSTVSPFYPW